ncbi:MAG: hypothetical protein Q8L69_03710 [Gallionellaceae bacterium]|nr:hypothetical protein [Gallionellaceae bacterium]
MNAKGGDGGQGGAGYGGGFATFTVVVDGTDMCGGTAEACNGQLLSGSYGGVAYSFHAPINQTDTDTTAGGMGGSGGSVNDGAGHDIMLKARNGNITLTNSVLDFGAGSAGWGGENGSGGWSIDPGPSVWVGVSMGGGDIAAEHNSSGTTYRFYSTWGSDGGVAGRLMLAAKGDVNLTNAWVSSYGYSGGTTNQRIDFLAGWDGATDGGGVPTGNTPYGGNIVVTNSNVYASWNGALSWQAGGDILFGTSYASAGNGAITLDAGGDISLGQLVADYSGTITVNAGGAILDGNGSAVNLKAQTIYLTSYYGGSVGALAISADIDNSDGGVNLLDADVEGGSYGGISLRVAGDAPVIVEVWDGAAYNNSIYFSATRDIDVDGDKYFISSNGGSIALYAGRDVNWFADADYTLDTTGSAIVTAGRNFYLDDIIYGNGGPNSSLALIAGNELHITGNGYISSDDWNDVVLIAGSAITIDSGAYVEGVNVGLFGVLGSGTLNLNGQVVAYGGQLEFNLANIIGGSGGSLSATGATSNITGIVSNNIVLDNGAYFQAGNDVSLTFKGAASTVSLSNGGYVLANSPSTISLAFAARSSGGVMIDGVATTTSLPGGSGFFVINTSTPAMEGFGLKIAYAGTSVSTDLCAISPALCKGPDVDPYRPPPRRDRDKDKKASCEEGSFGCEENQANDGKKDEKPGEKKVAQCSL